MCQATRLGVSGAARSALTAHYGPVQPEAAAEGAAEAEAGAVAGNGSSTDGGGSASGAGEAIDENICMECS